VVLGGNTRERAQISYQLWLENPTAILLNGDGGHIRKELIRLGTPEAYLLPEIPASTTWENASLSTPILRDRGVSRVAIVTSDFHSARALACFEAQQSKFEHMIFYSPVEDRVWNDKLSLHIQERLKRLCYAFIYGLWPWSCFPPIIIPIPIESFTSP